MENKKENKNGKMTLDRLAGMVARVFEKMATKEDIKEIKAKLTEHDLRFGKLEYRVDEIYDLVVDKEKDILDLQVRVNKLEDNVKVFNK